MKKALTILAAAVMLLAACGREGTPSEELTTAQTSASPGATTAPGSTDAADATAPPGGEPGATPAATSGTAPAKTTAPVQNADEGGNNQPKAGEYVYDISGEASDPTNPAAGKQKFDGDKTVEVTNAGAVTTRQETNTESAGRTTIRTKYESTRVLLLSFKQETAQGDFSCEFSPAPVIAKFPIKAETFPQQKLSGKGNACGGTLDIRVDRKENAKDANGRSWSTWVVSVKQHTETSQFTIDRSEARWVSPDLGMEIQTIGSTSGKVKIGATSQPFSGNDKSVLRSRP
jgi:hypothetical protein